MRHTLRVNVGLMAFLACCLVSSSAHATPPPSPEQSCQAARFKAAGAYAKCQAYAQARRENTADFSVYQKNASRCQDRYRAKWAKLQAKFPATSCAAARFVDNGTTVTDNLTALEWEKKTNLDSTPNGADPHDADNTYKWCADVNANFLCDNGVNTGPADGTLFTDFLASLDSAGGCFVGQCNWRVPTRDELQTILSGTFPCTTAPCIDPIFGPTQSDIYWSYNTYLYQPDNAWFVEFGAGVVGIGGKSNPFYARAVRGGL